MTKSKTSYLFPLMSDLEPLTDVIESKSDIVILSNIEKYDKNSMGFMTDYFKSRATFCAFHIVLNRRGLISPAFRPFWRVSKHIGLNEAEVMLARDLQVINLHYLYCQHFGRFPPTEVQYKNLFNTVMFDFELASKYALEEWRADTYSEYSLLIDDETPLELSSFRNEAVRSRVGSINESKRKMTKKLHEHARNPYSRINYWDVADKVLQYECLKYGRGSPSVASKFHKHITGKAFSKNEKSASELMRKKKNWFEKRMDVTSW